jgi:hypothetical protein
MQLNALGKSIASTPLRFEGEAERQAYYDRFSNLPESSLEKLYDVFTKHNMEEHKELAKRYGQEDANVDAVNKEIGSLARSRDAASDPAQKNAFQEKLNDLRAALGRVMKAFKEKMKK